MSAYKETYTSALQKLADWKDIKKANPVWGQTLCENIGKFEQYEYKGYVGKGEEAVIVRAWDHRNSREVAIKFALPNISTKNLKNIKARKPRANYRKMAKLFQRLMSKDENKTDLERMREKKPTKKLAGIQEAHIYSNKQTPYL